MPQRATMLTLYGMARTPRTLGLALFFVFCTNPLVDASFASLLLDGLRAVQAPELPGPAPQWAEINPLASPSIPADIAISGAIYADWYDGWAGAGSEHHRTLAIPAILELLDLRRGEQLLDIGCGPAPLAPYVIRAGAAYTGVDLSPRMVTHARERQGRRGRVLVADALDLAACDELRAGSFDATAFLLSIQNMDPLEPALASAA